MKSIFLGASVRLNFSAQCIACAGKRGAQPGEFGPTTEGETLLTGPVPRPALSPRTHLVLQGDVRENGVPGLRARVDPHPAHVALGDVVERPAPPVAVEAGVGRRRRRRGELLQPEAVPHGPLGEGPCLDLDDGRVPRELPRLGVVDVTDDPLGRDGWMGGENAAAGR